MLETINALMMSYFSDDKPVLARTLERKCRAGLLDEALSEGYITKTTPSSDGDKRYIRTKKGRNFVTR